MLGDVKAITSLLNDLNVSMDIMESVSYMYYGIIKLILMVLHDMLHIFIMILRWLIY